MKVPYKKTSEIPKGLGVKHDAEGVLRILPEFEAGLADVEGFSHLFVIWVFDRNTGFELTACPPSDNRTHGVFATRSPRRPNPIGLTVVQILGRDGARYPGAGRGHAGWHADPGHQAIPVERAGGVAAEGMAG